MAERLALILSRIQKKMYEITLFIHSQMQICSQTAERLAMILSTNQKNCMTSNCVHTVKCRSISTTLHGDSLTVYQRQCTYSTSHEYCSLPPSSYRRALNFDLITEVSAMEKGLYLETLNASQFSIWRCISLVVCSSQFDLTIGL